MENPFPPLSLSHPCSRHVSFPFLVSIPLAFAAHYTKSLQRWWMAQEEEINAQQSLPAIRYSLLFFFPLLLLIYAALVWVIQRLLFLAECTCSDVSHPWAEVPSDTYLLSCISFNVSSHAPSCPPVTFFISLFFMSLHVLYSCTSWHIPLYLQRLVLLLEYVFADVPVFFWLVPVLVHSGSVSCTAESAGTAHDQ